MEGLRIPLLCCGLRTAALAAGCGGGRTGRWQHRRVVVLLQPPKRSSAFPDQPHLSSGNRLHGREFTSFMPTVMTLLFTIAIDASSFPEHRLPLGFLLSCGRRPAVIVIALGDA